MNWFFGVNSIYAVLLWLGMGAMMGWLAVWIGRETKSGGFESNAGPHGQFVLRILAVLGGVIVLRALLGERISNTAFLASLGIASLGIAAVILVWKSMIKKKDVSML